MTTNFSTRSKLGNDLCLKIIEILMGIVKNKICEKYLTVKCLE